MSAARLANSECCCICVRGLEGPSPEDEGVSRGAPGPDWLVLGLVPLACAAGANWALLPVVPCCSFCRRSHVTKNSEVLSRRLVGCGSGMLSAAGRATTLHWRGVPSERWAGGWAHYQTARQPVGAGMNWDLLSTCNS